MEMLHKKVQPAMSFMFGAGN